MLWSQTCCVNYYNTTLHNGLEGAKMFSSLAVHKRYCITVIGTYPMTQLRSVTYRMRSHVPATRHKWTHHALTPARLDLPTLRDGRLSWPRWLVTYRDGLPARRRSPIQVLTGSSVDHLRWSEQRANHYTTPPPISDTSSHNVINQSLFSCALSHI